MYIEERDFHDVRANVECPFENFLRYDTMTNKMFDCHGTEYHFGASFTTEQDEIIKVAIAKDLLKTYHTTESWERLGVPNVINRVVYSQSRILEDIEQISALQFNGGHYVIGFYDMAGKLFNTIEMMIDNPSSMLEYIRFEFSIVKGVLASIYENKDYGNTSNWGISAYTKSVVVVGFIMNDCGGGCEICGPSELHEMVQGVIAYDAMNCYPLEILAIGAGRFAFGGSFVFTSDANLGVTNPIRLYDYNTYEVSPMLSVAYIGEKNEYKSTRKCA